MTRKLVALFLCLCLCLTGCGGRTPSPEPTTERAPESEWTVYADPVGLGEAAAAIRARDGYRLSAAVLYLGSAGTDTWKTTLDYLLQPLVLNLTAVAVDVSGDFDLRGLDLVYVDESVADCGEEVLSKIIEFTEGGGYVLLPNRFCDLLPASYLGISGSEALEAYPETLALPDVPEDLRPLQTLVSDFHSLYPHYADAGVLLERDYGQGMLASGAIPLVLSGDRALYTLNPYGAGAVLLTSPLLPNRFSRSAFSLVASEDQAPFSNTTASCNQLFLSEFAAFAAKQIYGFSLRRVFGAYGSPAMSWELHYEDITSIAHNSIGIFEPICREYRQVPSISLIRSTYTWFEQAETLGYALNTGGSDLRFALDREESAYSSGTHIAVEDEWLQLNALQNCISYFDDSVSENYRLCPCVLDYDGDGNADAFCGSADGRVYYFRGLGFTGKDGRYRMEKPVELEGVALSGFSAPTLADLNRDGDLDLLVGGADGCVYLYPGRGSLDFGPGSLLLNGETTGQCLPSAGDLNGDGITDLAVGSDTGILDLYYGVREGDSITYTHRRMADLTRQCAELGLGKWLSPNAADWNGDGVTDLALGTYDGYVALLRGAGEGKYAFDRYITAEDMNYKGNANLKFGHYCTPAFYDLDRDGSPDLLCGYEEYGMAYSIDSPYFPYREELRAQVDFAKENHYYVGVHFLTGYYYSAEREAYELRRQLEAFREYGLTGPWGANQHTWRMSVLEEAQSLESIWKAGLLWESGYAPSGSTHVAPQVAAENVIALPFFLMREGERTLLIQNCSVLAYRDESWTDLSGRYGMPVLVYYHCDMIYKSDGGARNAAAQVAGFQEKFGYNFVMENQLMYGIAAAESLAVTVEAEGDGLSIRPETADPNAPLFDRNAWDAVGTRVEFSSRWRDPVGTDAAVWSREDRALTLGLDRTVRLFPDAGEDEPHILRVNTPADISLSPNGAVIAFRENGMQQAAVLGSAVTDDPGWITDSREGMTVFTAYEEAPVLHIQYQEVS